jgi:1,4-dihydroxy-2-naphthoate octaprenyltransferase/chlorophyll synthase
MAHSLSLWERWWFALKPGSWPKLGVAALVGQAIGVAATGSVDLMGLLAGATFTLFVVGYTVLVNDWGDQEVDALKRRLFPEMGSAKTIPDRILEARSVAWAGAGAAAAAAGIAIAAQVFMGRPGLAWGGIICLAFVWAYTLPPLRLNYRGGGELLEMVGVGFALPWWNAYVQGGSTLPAGMVVLPSFALLCLASALASGLADEESDRLGGKRTFVTAFGGPAVRQAVEGLVLAAMVVWAALPRLAPRYATFWMVLPAVAIMALDYRELRKAALAPDIETYYGLANYKRRLHECIWRGAIALALTVAVTGILGGGLGGLA